MRVVCRFAPPLKNLTVEWAIPAPELSPRMRVVSGRGGNLLRLCSDRGELVWQVFRERGRMACVPTAVAAWQHDDWSVITTSNKEITMIYRNTRSFSPRAALDELGARFGEYPVRLTTRRAVGLSAEKILERRECAPNPVWCDPRSNPDLFENRS
jgi:hypothetical protein